MYKYLMFLLISSSVYSSEVLHERFKIHQSHRIAHSGCIAQSMFIGELNEESLSEWDKFGNTPLHYASFYNKKDNILALARYGVDLDARNQFGYTPLYYALRKEHQDVIITLIYCGANSYITDHKGVSLRDVASYHQIDIMDTVEVCSSSDSNRSSLLESDLS